LAVPRLEDRPDCPNELHVRILGQVLTGLLDEDAPEIGGQASQRSGRQPTVIRHVVFAARPGQRPLEQGGVNAEHRAPIHLHQPPVTIPREPVATPGGQTGQGLVGQPDVEDRLHHPRHREPCARPDRDQ
jgi:hypothetical protein